MLTYQDFKSTKDLPQFLLDAISDHRSSLMFRVARDANLYDRQHNKTINEYVKMIFTLTGTPVEDFTASNAKISSNFFNRLNTQRCMYSLGNGISFTDKTEEVDERGVKITVDNTKRKLGLKFDTDLKNAAYYALIHGVSFCFWNVDRMHVFPVTEFVPLWDEETGVLHAGVRFWRLDDSKPMMVVLYEDDGYSSYYLNTSEEEPVLKERVKKRAYKMVVHSTEVESNVEVEEENWSILPIVPLWGSRLRQSTLVGMRQSIDSFDLIRSGFANDLTDCAQVYWILENCSGMSQKDLAQFRDRLKISHIATADTENGGKITPYTQEIPYSAREAYLSHIRSGIYEDFGGLDVHTIAAGATNDHIDAAYQPLDENADDFEFQVIEAVQQILELQGIEDTPIFKRNRISNQKEQVEMVVMEAPYLDDETILQKLPNITPDEVQEILARRDMQDMARFEDALTDDPEGNQEEPPVDGAAGGEG